MVCLCFIVHRAPVKSCSKPYHSGHIRFCCHDDYGTASPKFYQRLAPYLYLVGFIMLILVDAFGTTSKGAQRWLDLWFYLAFSRLKLSNLQCH